MSLDITGGVSNLIAERNKTNRLIKLHNDRVGTLECLKILMLNMRMTVIRERIDSLTQELSEEKILDKPLMIVTGVNGENYQVKLARGDQLITGEYISIEDLVKIVNHSSNFIANMTRLEELLILNSLSVYAELATNMKNTYAGKKYNGLTKSKKFDYLYHYMPDRKHTLRFIAEKN
jgi:hypothetical protein